MKIKLRERENEIKKEKETEETHRVRELVRQNSKEKEKKENIYSPPYSGVIWFSNRVPPGYKGCPYSHNDGCSTKRTMC